MMRTIDDRDIVINQGSARRAAFGMQAIAGMIVAVVALAGLWLLIQTFDPQARAAREVAQLRAEQLDTQLYGVDMVAGAVLRLVLPLALATAALGVVIVGLMLLYRRYAEPTAIAAHFHVKALEAQYQIPVPQTLTYSPPRSGRLEMTQAEPLDVTPAAPQLPGMTDLATLNHTPTPQAVLLGLGDNGERITVPANKLFHIALCGTTGGGKSNTMRLIVPQLQAIGARVVLADPHYTPFDAQSGDDWRPIEQRLYQKPAVKPAEIDALFAWTLDELDRRLELRNRGEKWGTPLFLALDELPVIADSVPDAIERLSRILREGRKVGVLTIGASQSMLVKAIGGDSSVRDAYRSAFYFGGDKKSAAALLDMPERTIDDGAIHTGLAMLRSDTTTPPRLVRIPYASNDALYQLLGAPAIVPANEARPFGFVPANAGSSQAERRQYAGENNVPASASEQAKLSAEEQRIVDLFLSGKDAAAIVEAVHNISSSRGGSAYRQKLAEVQAVIRRVLTERGV